MAKVNSEILTWARDQAGLSMSEAAQLLGIKTSKTASAEEKLFAYEQGKELSRSMLKEMGRVYRRPILTFYLENPPIKTKRGEDFRTLPNNLDPQQHFHVDVLITDVTARQSIIREALLEEDEMQPLAFIGKSSMDMGVGRLVSTMYELFDISLREYRSQQNYDKAFKYLREKLEAKGIFVLLKGNLGSYHTDIALNVFRGFALCDDIAPLIVINHQESKSSSEIQGTATT